MDSLRKLIRIAKFEQQARHASRHHFSSERPDRRFRIVRIDGRHVDAQLLGGVLELSEGAERIIVPASLAAPFRALKPCTHVGSVSA